jgi:hypothetical protein
MLSKIEKARNRFSHISAQVPDATIRTWFLRDIDGGADFAGNADAKPQEGH